jgi:hypothetical protein
MGFAFFPPSKSRILLYTLCPFYAQAEIFQYGYFRFLTPDTRNLKPNSQLKHHVTPHPYTLEIKSFDSNPLPAIFDDFIHLPVGTFLV